MLEIMEEYLSMCPPLTDMDRSSDFAACDCGWALYDAGEETVALYWDGSRLKAHSFFLQFRAPAATDQERQENAALLQKVVGWLMEMSDNGILPELEEGQYAQKIDCESSGMGAMDADGINAGYHLHLQLTYEERRESLAS